MKSENNIFGCFVSASVNWNDDQKIKEVATERGALFRSYVWGNKGIDAALKQLCHQDYGSDLTTILFQFYINPVPYELSSLKEIERYRKTEKSIGVPIVVNEDNFFSKSESERRFFLVNVILGKLCLLEDIVKKRKLDTNIGQLKQDIARVLCVGEENENDNQQIQISPRSTVQSDLRC